MSAVADRNRCGPVADIALWLFDRAFKALAGDVALQPKTMIDVVKQIGDWVYASGFKRLFIMNTHVSNLAPLRCALEMLRAEHDGLIIAVINSARSAKCT